MEKKPRVSKTRCPNCDSVIKLDTPREGSIITCPGCAVELEVISADPFEVDFTEDWQDE
jgi:lysine biosynthesis protein LysW